MSKAAETAKSIFQAFVDKDRAAAERLIAEDFHFTSPLDNKIDRAAYFAICWPNSKSMTDVDFHHVVADGERVFVTYEAGNTNGKRFRNTEIIVVKGDKITAVEVYFGWNVPHEVTDGEHRDPAS